MNKASALFCFKFILSPNLCQHCLTLHLRYVCVSKLSKKEKKALKTVYALDEPNQNSNLSFMIRASLLYNGQIWNLNIPASLWGNVKKWFVTACICFNQGLFL